MKVVSLLLAYSPRPLNSRNLHHNGCPTTFLRSHLAVTAIPAGQVSSYNPYAYFASAAYCSASATKTWSCGSCQANPDFKPVATRGDGTSVQYCSVGSIFQLNIQSVIVAHQGTSTKSILPLLTDITFVQESLNATMFSRMDSEIRVHSGFAGEHVKTARAVLAAVNSTFNTSSVTVTRHSLTRICYFGAALALLDSVYLSLHLPVSTSFTTISSGTFLSPSVGWFSAVFILDDCSTRKDPIPVVPGKLLQLPAKAIFTSPLNKLNSSTGQDTGNALCSVGEVEDLFEGVLSDHDGPYDGVRIGAAC
ncbi:lipase [Mycena alexandri]|uniref:Lipase n=1 Tax=Mycena alexandri TaxID=1745969 RepID=A0AAD6SXL3_9AGAR|nr:lipase [Mycena alexandri]